MFSKFSNKVKVKAFVKARIRVQFHLTVTCQSCQHYQSIMLDMHTGKSIITGALRMLCALSDKRKDGKSFQRKEKKKRNYNLEITRSC